MNDPHHLQRFVDAQAGSYTTALAEIRSGKKRSHWMWYIFPQAAGLGNSAYAVRYAVSGRNEAEAYLQHPLLGHRLNEICKSLLELGGSDAFSVFGSPDHLKLHSSMTLFASVPSPYHAVFKGVLEKYFSGQMNPETLSILENNLSAGG